MKSFRGISLIIFVFLLSGCSGNSKVESLFKPDPNLSSSSPKINNSTQNNNNQAKENKLPEDFPQDIPIYDSAQLVAIDKNISTWVSNDPLNLITNHYQQQLVSQEWDIITTEENLIIAQKKAENRTLNVSFSVEDNQSKFIITQEEQLATTIPDINQNNSSKTNNSDNKTNNSDSKTDNDQEVNSQLPSSLQQLIRLQIIPQDNKQLSPYETINRREYARWLVKTNNILYANVNSKLIRLANPQSKPIFSDVPNNDPDFMVIQGLAEAGLIPSSLTQDTNTIAFSPDKPLTREDLIAWKVTLDFRQNLPITTLDSIKETWGFQDASKIAPRTWSELYVDWQNGENANIRKAFGYITLFQPQKNVTYEEAAEVLSSFGYQSNIVFLKEVNQK